MTSSPPHLIPMAPPIEEWTEDHFEMFSLVELVIGHYKEVSKEEREEKARADEIAEKMKKGEDWKSELEQFVEEEAEISIEDLLSMDDDSIALIGKQIDDQLKKNGEII